MTEAYDTTLETALAWHREGKGAVLATVIETWGSAPRPAGSLLVVSGEGKIEGSVSGGCVEGAVMAEALDILGKPGGKVLSYGVSDDDAFSVGLACGGTIRVMVEAIGSGIPVEMLERIVAARAGKEPLGYVVDIESWDRRLAEPSEFPDRFRHDRSGVEDDGRTFVAVYNPPLRLVVVGAVHIAQPLMPMARLLGYDATLIDPREAFASQERFPGAKIVTDWPQEALAAHGLDPRTALVTLTHDPKIDDPAIEIGLRSDAFYIGSLGSKRTHSKRVERLTARGVTAEEFERLHAPIGLPIGSKSPAEIALAIMAQITDVLRHGD